MLSIMSQVRMHGHTKLELHASFVLAYEVQRAYFTTGLDDLKVLDLSGLVSIQSSSSHNIRRACRSRLGGSLIASSCQYLGTALYPAQGSTFLVAKRKSVQSILGSTNTCKREE